MEKDLQKKVLELNQAREAAQREMQLEVAEAENGFREKLVAAVESFGRDEAFAVVLDRNAVAYFHPSRDVTTAIVDRFNKMFPVPQDAPAAKDEGRAPLLRRLRRRPRRRRSSRGPPLARFLGGARCATSTGS